MINTNSFIILIVYNFIGQVSSWFNLSLEPAQHVLWVEYIESLFVFNTNLLFTKYVKDLHNSY